MLTSFPPVITPGTRVLILGSMPGQRSLDQQQYYAHPRNLFWPIMQELLGVPRQAPYPERLERLTAAGVGLWDVLMHCEREGSLDADIDRATEVPNDFRSLFEHHPALRALCFNGQKARSAFRRHVEPALPARIRLVTLPSTSPANAGLSLQAKLARWREIQSLLI